MRSSIDIPGCAWRPCSGLQAYLLADAESGEDRAEQIVAPEFAGDLAERLLRRAQFLRGEFAGAALQMVCGRLQVPGDVAQRDDVSCACAEGSCCGVGCSAETAQRVAQQRQAIARSRRQGDVQRAFLVAFGS